MRPSRSIISAGSYVGLADPATHAIRIDDHAAGHGWFVDPTPFNDREFVKPGDQGEQRHIDLLSVLAHELGHLVGLDDHDAGHAADVMGESLGTGTRRMPTKADVGQVVLAGASDSPNVAVAVAPTIPHRPIRRR
jgi:hypothetical protein